MARRSSRGGGSTTQPMRHALITTHASARYGALHDLNVRVNIPGCHKISSELWRLPPFASSAVAASVSERCFNSGSIQDLLFPLARSTTFEGLIGRLRARQDTCTTPWRLRFVDCSPTRGGPRAGELSSAVARYLDGPPAIVSDAPEAETADLVLLRARRLWYLCEAAPRASLRRIGAGDADADEDAAHADAARIWAARPYSFSAATELALAKLAVSLALSHATPAGSRPSGATGATPTVLDPCCGSGTVLFAAAMLGATAVGCDLNPRAVEGSTRNLHHCVPRAGGTLVPSVHLFDCTSPLPAEIAKGVEAVVASLPWGRNQRIPHALYLRELLGSVAASLPAVPFCLISAEPIPQVCATEYSQRPQPLWAARKGKARERSSATNEHTAPSLPPAPPRVRAAASGAVRLRACASAASAAARSHPPPLRALRRKALPPAARCDWARLCRRHLCAERCIRRSWRHEGRHEGRPSGRRKRRRHGSRHARADPA